MTTKIAGKRELVDELVPGTEIPFWRSPRKTVRRNH
jgi:hypothetical protein